MTIATILFYFFGGTAALSGFGILLTRNVFHGALLLLGCLLSVAAVYVLMFAEFIAVVQLLIYAGGVLVVMIFGIMLTSKISGKPLIVKNSKWGAGLLVAVSFLCVLGWSFSEATFTDPTPPLQASNSVNEIGIALMRDFVAPFEIAGLLLLVSLIGAAIIASFKKQP
jgi:NADH:ubiquinone oxidoreductase subunit 6 (subunit J)